MGRGVTTYDQEICTACGMIEEINLVMFGETERDVEALLPVVS
jgi:hypothetical protein